MATLSQIGFFNKNQPKQLPTGIRAPTSITLPAPTPPPPSTQPSTSPADYTPQGPDNQDDLLAQIANALSGARGGSGGFKGSSGSSQAQTDLSLQQTTDLINATAANQKANFGILANSLQQKLGYSDTSYQQALQGLSQQYGQQVYGQNASAAAAGAGVSAGNQYSLGQLQQSNALQQAMLGSKHTLADSQIVDAQKKAFAQALLANTKIGQEQQMNALQRSEAGIGAPVWT